MPAEPESPAPPPPPEPGVHEGWFWGMAAGAGALAVAGGVVAYFAFQTHDEFLTYRRDDPDAASVAERGEALQWTADGLWAAGIACAVAATVLAFVVDWGGAESPEAGHGPTVMAGPGGVALAVEW